MASKKTAGINNLRQSATMARLLDALESGQDIGHFGRLTFAIVARHFLDEDRIVSLLADQPDVDEERARVMLKQVQARDYNPPRRETLLEWQAQQDFQICPEGDDPDGCNLYRELRFPEEIYEDIQEYWEEKAEAEE